MVETAAHLTDHVFPRLPVRQWVLSVPKRLRYFMQRDGAVLNMVLRIFLRVIAQSLSVHCPGAARLDKAALHIGAVAFIHRFGLSLNAHVHFHVCVVDGVFEVVPGEADADAQATAPSVIFHPASEVDETTVAQVQADLRRRILRTFVGRGLIERVDAKEVLAYLWVVLIARICEVFPLRCPMCGGQMRRIAFITERAQIRQILDHIGVASEPPRIAPARGPPLWHDCDAQMDDGVQIEPNWDMTAQPAPDYEVDQRINW